MQLSLHARHGLNLLLASAKAGDPLHESSIAIAGAGAPHAGGRQAGHHAGRDRGHHQLRLPVLLRAGVLVRVHPGARWQIRR